MTFLATPGSPAESIEHLIQHIPDSWPYDRRRAWLDLHPYTLTAEVTLDVDPEALIALPIARAPTPGAYPVRPRPFDQGLRAQLVFEFRSRGYDHLRGRQAPITVQVDNKGFAVIADGLVRVSAAAAAGITVPARIEYYGGSERLKTAWQPQPKLRVTALPDFDFQQIGAPIIGWFAGDLQNTFANNSYVDGATISTVYDASNNQNHLLPPSGSIGPQFVANMLNGRPGFRFALRDHQGTSSATATTVVASEAGNWSTDMWVGFTLTIVSGTGAGQVRTVSSNTSNTITVSVAWATIPDATSVWNLGPSQFVTAGGVTTGGLIKIPGAPTGVLFHPWTEVAVVIYRALNTHNNPIMWDHAAGGGGNTYANTSGGNTLSIVHAGTLTSNGVPGQTLHANVPSIVYTEYNDNITPSRLRLNGNEFDGVGPDGAPPGPYINTMSMGAGINNAHPSNIDILELGFIAGSLSPRSRDYVEHGLSLKYGGIANL